MYGAGCDECDSRGHKDKADDDDDDDDGEADGVGVRRLVASTRTVVLATFD